MRHVTTSWPSNTASTNVMMGCEGCQAEAATGSARFNPTMKKNWLKKMAEPPKRAQRLSLH